MAPPKNSTVNTSQDVSLACQAEAHPANLTYSWFQNGINVFHIRWGHHIWSGGDGELIVVYEEPLDLDPSSHVPYCSHLQSRVQILVDGSLRLQAAQPDDAGLYTCVPSNGLLHPPSASAYLTVLCKHDPSSFHSLLLTPGPGQGPLSQFDTAFS